jgi:hypothetical protein
MIIQVDHVTDNRKIDIVVCYDNCGNIYFKHENDYYFLMIGNDDTIDIQQSHNMQRLLGATQAIKLEKLKNSNDEKSLKGKILNKLEEKKIEDEGNEESDESEDEGETEFERNNRFFPEQKYYYHDEVDSDEDIDDDEFKFYSSGDTSILQFLDLNLNSSASYNTLVMNPYTKTVEMSLESVGSNAYILVLYTNGQIDLNVVGSKRKSFRLTYHENNEEDIQEGSDNKIFIAKCINVASV